MRQAFLRQCRAFLFAIAAACSLEPVPVPVGQLSAHAFALEANGAPFSEWSEPVKLDATINIPGVTDSNPFISKDELSLYFDSDRTDLGGLGARDIFVARRDCVTCPWQTPVNLGSRINTPYVDGSPALSDDGHFLFFISHAPTADCQIDPNTPPPDPIRPCLEDIYVSVRSNPNDDLGWRPASRLGPEVNGPGPENEPEFQRNADGGGTNLYFARSLIPGSLNSREILRVAIQLRGVGSGGEPVIDVLGTPELVTELNALNIAEFGVTIRSDSKELYFSAPVARGGLGAIDMWSSTRQNVNEAWSEPVNVGAPLNTRFQDLAPSLSHDGRTMYFASARSGPAPSTDIWVTTRTLGGR